MGQASSSAKNPTIEEILWRFPHIGEKIFKNLSNKNLVKCKIVSKSWNHFIINQKFYQQRVRYEELQKKHWKKVEKRMVDLDIAIREAIYQEPDMVKSLILIKELQLKKLPNIKMTLSKACEHKGHLLDWIKVEKRMIDLDLAIRDALNYEEPNMAECHSH